MKSFAARCQYIWNKAQEILKNIYQNPNNLFTNPN